MNFNEEIQSELKRCGYEVFSEEKHWLYSLRLHLGEKRFKRFEEQVEAVQKGLLSGRQLYDTLYQPKDFALVLSRDFSTLVKVYEDLFLNLKNLNVTLQGVKVLDLGCGIAAIHSLLHRLFGLKLMGVDTSGNALMAAADLHPQSDFMMWDFQKNTCVELENYELALCVFGVDFESLNGKVPEGVNQFSPYLSRQSQYHLQRKEEAYILWENWDETFSDQANFVQVLRIAWFDHFVAWVDVAQESGWRILEAHWVEPQDERFPSITWVKSENQEEWDIKQMVSFWGREI